jgi:hypothetical protein
MPSTKTSGKKSTGARRVAKRGRPAATTTMKKEADAPAGARRAKRPTAAKKRPVARRSTKNPAGKSTRARSNQNK